MYSVWFLVSVRVRVSLGFRDRVSVSVRVTLGFRDRVRVRVKVRVSFRTVSYTHLTLPTKRIV